MAWIRKARWILLGVIAAGFLGTVAFSRLITDWLWFQHLGYEALFTRPILWRLATGAGAAVLAGGVLWINLRMTKGAVVQAFLRFSQGDPSRSPWKRVSRLVVFGSAVAGVLVGGAFSEVWEVAAFGLHAESFGAVDPLFGKDIGFYVFTLPFLQVLKAYASLVLLLAALLVAGVYLASGSFYLEGFRVRIAPGPRVHLSVLLALLAVLKAGDYALAAYELVYSTRGAVYGAAYADVHASLPAYRTLTLIALLVAVAALANAFRPAMRFVAAGVGLLVTASAVGAVFPALVQQYVVRPNELDRELPYIERHIEMTRLAYGLGRISEREFEHEFEFGPNFAEEHAAVLENVRLWDWRPLLDTYAQLQELRPYYDFIEVDVDRYVLDGKLRQVMLAARELTSASLQNPSWINRHLQYTHGYGLVMSPSNRVTPQGLPDFIILNIPPESRVPGLEVTRPEIYYGEQEADYVVVKTKRPEFDYGSGDQNVTTFYEGKGGVPIGNFLRRIAFAARTGTLNILLSRDITAESRVMLYRSVKERVGRLAPFLRFDSDPYLVLAEGRLFWIVDAYTRSFRHPYVEPVAGWGNYVRNSVKVVIDAYHGSVDFYVVDEEPIIRALSRIYPGVFKPGSEMPQALREHLRYPEELFRIQAAVLTRYHVTNPQVFYNGEDVWELPREIVGEQEVPMDPYYAILQLPDADDPEFVLMLPFTPMGKANMIGWLAARSDGERYGEMILYEFSKQEVTFGPRQFEARIDQDPEISSQLTLWSQQGSRVIRGNLLVIPAGSHLLYVEPIYLQAEQSPMPEFVRVVVGNGRTLAMARTFEEALAALMRAESAQRPQQPAGSPKLQEAPEPRSATNVDPGEAAPGSDGAPPGSGVAALVEEALAHFEAAQKSAAAGDWAAWGEALDDLARTLERLKAIAGAP